MSDHCGASYDAQRAQWLLNYASYYGGSVYRNPPPTTLSSQTLQWTGTRMDGERSVPTSESQSRISYLVPHPVESDRSYDLRRALASYVNSPQIVVDAYADAVSSKVQRDYGSLAPYMDDVDGRGTSWGEFSEEGARWDCVYGVTATVVDTTADAAAQSRAEEIAKGVRPYCVLVHATSFAWCEVDKFGRPTVFAYVDSPYGERAASGYAGQQHVRVRVYYTGTSEAPRGYWEVREGTISILGTAGGLGSQREALGTIVEQGELPPELNGQIPVVFSFYKRDTSQRFPLGLSLIDDTCDIARGMYNRRSWADQIAREAGFPTLAVPLAKTGGQMDPGARIAIGTGKAIGYDSSTGAPGWIQPSSEWSRELRDKDLADFQLALRTAGMELAAEAGASSSGEALRIRSRDFESRAQRFARQRARYENAVLTLFAVLAGEDADFTITYPHRYVLPDLSADLDRALKVLDRRNDVGPTATRAATLQLVSSALVLDDETRTTVASEIEQAAAEKAAAAAARPPPPPLPPRPAPVQNEQQDAKPEGDDE